MLLPEMSPPLAQVWILGVLPERSQDNQASGGLVSGEGEGHREHAGSGILRKQSWIRGLDTPAPGENLIPNRQAASFLPPPRCPWPASYQPALPQGCTIPSGESAIPGISLVTSLLLTTSSQGHSTVRGSLSVDSWDLSWG